MRLAISVAAAGPPVTLPELKTWVSQFATNDDTQLAALLNAATGQVQSLTGRQLMQQTYIGTCDTFPQGGDDLEIPRPPLIDVQIIQYRDPAGTLVTLPTASYTVEGGLGSNQLNDPYATAGRVRLNLTYSWPAIQYGRPGAVAVTFNAGYGSAPGYVPPDLALAVKILAGAWYDGTTPIGEIHPTTLGLCRPYRIG